MATIKGVMHSYISIASSIQRSQKNKARTTAKNFKEQQKADEIVNAEQAVNDWESYVDLLKSLHKNCSEGVDWKEIEKVKKPEEPSINRKEQNIAKDKFENFIPSVFDTIFGSSEKKKNKLNHIFKTAKAKDDFILQEFSAKLEDWEYLQNIRLGVKNKKIESYKNAIEYFNPFPEIEDLGQELNFTFDENFIDVELRVNNSEVIPTYELKQTATGRLSKKTCAKSKFNELYQDYVCSATIRIARELFAYLPVEHVRVNSMTNILNTSNGHQEEKCILSVIFTNSAILNLDLNKIDPSDSISNFVHNMNFTKMKGFDAVEKVALTT